MNFLSGLKQNFLEKRSPFEQGILSWRNVNVFLSNKKALKLNVFKAFCFIFCGDGAHGGI